jgi:thymidine kinase
VNLKHTNGLATNEGPTVDLGAEEKYFPACYKCYRREIEQGKLARLQMAGRSH